MIDYDNIRKIHSDTVRVVTDAGRVPNNSTFIYASNGFYVKAGTPYHIHYTSDLQEHFMTGAKHSITSRIIKKVREKTNFQLYTENRGKKYTILEPLQVKGTPNSNDYIEGFFVRYFALKLDSEDAPIEVNADFESPLYDVHKINWVIAGSKTEVKYTNNRSSKEFRLRSPRFKKILTNPLEYYIEPFKSEFQETLEKLGLGNVKRDKDGNIMKPEAGNAPMNTEETTTSGTSISQTQNLPSGFNAGSGPPPGFGTGGSGGGGGAGGY
tara:strand:- start:1230 stop:2033 length:804 start_codon:yes stop_codon:yes gene_type:complete